MQENSESTYSRSEILTWINETLKLNLMKIEQLGTGSVYCQLLDILYPGKIALNKVNWRAKYEYEYVNNFKLLQQSFLKLDISRPIDIEKLVKSKYQDNFEFIVFFKKLFDSNANNSTIKEYNPILRRGTSEMDLSFGEKVNHKGSVGRESIIKYSKNNNNGQRGSLKPPSIKNNSFVSNNQNNDYQYDTIKAERDFYYSKIKDIDHFLDVVNKEKNSQELIQCIRDIIYNIPEKIVVVGKDGSLTFENNVENVIEEINWFKGDAEISHRENEEMNE